MKPLHYIIAALIILSAITAIVISDNDIYGTPDSEIPILPINTTPFNMTDGIYKMIYPGQTGPEYLLVQVEHLSEDVVLLSFGDRKVTYRKQTL